MLWFIFMFGCGIGTCLGAVAAGLGLAAKLGDEHD